MNKNIFVHNEFLNKMNISEKTLKEWEKLKLVKPVGLTDDQIPFYSDNTVERVTQIQKLSELGYGIEEIQKIIKKVGLPRSVGANGEALSADKYLTVGSLAERVGVSPRTIKHWEDKGIIDSDMRSEGGFRLYSEIFVYLCKLIKDLQLFGYSLEQIKVVSDYFRDFLAIQSDIEIYPKTEVIQKLDAMLNEIKILFDKMNLLKDGIRRWDDLLKKKRKEILNLKNQNKKQLEDKKSIKNE